MRLLLSGSLLLLVAACAQPTATVAAPQPGSAPLAVDLGGSSRIPRVAASAGEGEGYGVVPAVAAASVDHSRMDHSKMDHGAMSVMNQAPAPVAVAAPVDHSRMDYSKMDHGAVNQSQAPAAAPQVAHVEGSGTVNSVDAAGHKVNLNHNPIPAIGWPSMTMDFAVAPSVDLRALKPGTRVNFMMQRGGDGMYVIHSITPAGGQ